MIAAATCTASCTSDPEPEALEWGEEMQFEAMEAPVSRTVLSTTANLKDKPFMLFGEVNRTGVFYQGLQRIFNGATVTYKNNKWTYDTPIYWLMGQEHSFVAIHPANIQEISGEIKYSDSRVSFEYETPDSTYKESTDILVATHRRKYSLDNAGAVKFGFKHILTRLNIAPAIDEVLMYEDEKDIVKYPYNESEYIQIHRIELYGLRTKAKFSFASAPLQRGEVLTDERTETYDLDEESVKDIKLDFRDDTIKVTNNKENVAVFDDKNALLLLPQKIDDRVYAILYYTVNGDHTENKYIRKITLPLSGIGEWERGKSYTYKFSIQKVYTGQIKPGSLEWVIKDLNITDTKESDEWIKDIDEPIRQEFDIEDEKSDETE